MCPPVIEAMRLPDLDEVAELASAAFGTPWSRMELAQELERPFAYARVLREEPTGPIRAFACSWHVADEVHVLHVATHPAARRRGHARRLMQDVIEFARHTGAREVSLELRESNAAACALYIALGFLIVGKRPRYYTDTGEDAVLMTLEIAASGARR